MESNAFSKSISSSKPTLLNSLQYCIRSYINLVFSSMYLSFKKPFWSSDIICVNKLLILFAMTPVIILLSVVRSEIGLQFFKYSLDLFPFGIQVITPLFCVIDNSPEKKDSLIARTKKCPKSIQLFFYKIPLESHLCQEIYHISFVLKYFLFLLSICFLRMIAFEFRLIYFQVHI